jgi:hypothetical protein
MSMTVKKLFQLGTAKYVVSRIIRLRFFFVFFWLRVSVCVCVCLCCVRLQKTVCLIPFGVVGCKCAQISCKGQEVQMDQTSQSEKVLQKQKFDEIVEILLSAGYFRARINTLSEFDKVVGGLCWCITNSGEDVDVDILFQENSTIGQRIALSEAIVRALRKMNCPSPLQAHQIQGGVGHLSDFPAIHPVIVWLVKKCIQRREEQEFQLRQFSTLQFGKNYEIPSESDLFAVSSDLQKIMDRNKAVRQFRRRQLKDESEETRIHSCLLEFGESVLLGKSASGGGAAGADGKTSSKGGGKGGSSTAASSGMIQITMKDLSDISLSSATRSGGSSEQLSGFEKKLAQAAKEAQREEAMFAEHAQKEEEALMKQMMQVGGSADGTGAGMGLSGSQVGAIVGMGSSEIGSAAAAYALEVEESRKQMEANLASGKLGQAAAYKRQRANLLKQSDEIDVRQGECQASTQLIQDKLRVIEEERDGALDYIAQLQVQIQKLKDLEAASTQQEELAMLKKLVALNESLRAQENAFKASCKAQMADYNARIAALSTADAEDDEETKKLRGIEEMHAKVCGLMIPR